MKKRTIVIILSLLLAFVMVFAGCTNKDEPVAATKAPVQDKTEEAEEEATPEPMEDAAELKWYVIGSLEQPDQDMVEEAINEYAVEKINAMVDIIFLDYGPYQETMGTKLAAGEEIDICFTSGWAGTAEYKQNAALGNFTALNKYFEEGGALNETLQLIGEDFMYATQIDGVSYAVPCNKEQAHNWGFLFREDIVEELSLDIASVKSTEDLEPILAAVKAAYPEMYGLVTATGEAPFRLLDWNIISGDDVPGALYPDNRDTTIVNQFATSEALAHFTTMKAYYDAGYIRADADTSDAWQADLDSGLGFAVSQSMKPGKGVEFSQGRDYNYIQVDTTDPVMSNREADGSMMAIPIASKNPDKAAEFINLANVDKYMNNLLNFGIEDYHFTKVSDNIIELSEDNAGWRPNITWVFPNQFMNYTMSSEDPDKFVNFVAYNQSSTPLNNLGFVYNGSDMENTVSALKAITAQYTARLYSGAVSDVEALVDEMNQKMEAAGMSDLIEDMQKQFDMWLAGK